MGAPAPGYPAIDERRIPIEVGHGFSLPIDGHIGIRQPTTKQTQTSAKHDAERFA